VCVCACTGEVTRALQKRPFWREGAVRALDLRRWGEKEERRRPAPREEEFQQGDREKYKGEKSNGIFYLGSREVVARREELLAAHRVGRERADSAARSASDTLW
jgi:hypothetical protein